jgi:cytochrome c oxidase subunit II
MGRSTVRPLIDSILLILLCGILTVPVFGQQPEQIIKMTAKRFEYSPREIVLHKGVPTVLEITALDRLHGFSCPDLNIRADLLQGKVTRIRFTPKKNGNFAFHCDIFCGDGHEDMSGTFIVTE